MQHPPDFTKGNTITDWWPDKLNLAVLSQNAQLVNPMGVNYDYRDAFKRLDYDAVKRDLYVLMTDSQPWWPADYGHYGPFFIRMAWHSAGTYRIGDGRGGAKDGTQRFPPLNSWPDNVNLDKARRLLWPIKQKYGRRLSWADLMIFAGTFALESMGMKPIGVAGGREDVWEPQLDVFWGAEKTWLTDTLRYGAVAEAEKSAASADNAASASPGAAPDDVANRNALDNPLAATEMGLIYVNPEGPDRQPIPAKSAMDVRITFRRMGMTDEETVALVAGGHTFGKTHGAASPSHLGPEPQGAPIQEQGLGWKNNFGTGNADDTIGSGLEGAWKANPTTWDMGYLTTMFKYEYELTTSPAGAYIWLAKDVEPQDMVQDAHVPGKWHRPMMSTADLGLKFDPVFEKIARHYLAHPQEFHDAFARAWFKLTHRDFGPPSLYLGPDVPTETFLWQDPIPVNKNYTLYNRDVDELKKAVRESGLTVGEMVRTAWASASTFRGSDKRGGANGGRIRLKPQINWEVNQPDRLKPILQKYEIIRAAFHQRGIRVSMADLIILGGAVGIETAAHQAGATLHVPFAPGRMDASQAETDIEGMAVLEPRYDGFRNYLQQDFAVQPEDLLVDKAQLLNLTPPEMTVLLGGLRVLGNNYDDSPHGVFTDRPGQLTPDFFTHLLDMDTEWKPTVDKNRFNGICRATGAQKWTATRVDLIFGFDAQLRAVCEVYAAADGRHKFLHDFVIAWNKVMNADRFDLLN
ncbi:MAG: catalase/peroxidase HPI [Defluviitaleaceae bacterium]|nr:catalase/peroxidase HPI [Defluviitaleaceae bacterium]